MLHGILHLRLNELVITNSVSLLRFKFLDLSFLPLQIDIDLLGLLLKPLNLRLKPSNIIIIAELPSSFHSLVPKINQFLFDLGHMALIGRLKVFLVVLQHSLKLHVYLVH